MILISVISLLIVGCTGLNTSPQCKDDSGKPVDWFYIYKIPKDKGHSNSLVRRGVAYMYMTPDTARKGWLMSRKNIKNPDSMPGRTLAPLYKDPNVVSLMYNDQPPIAKKIASKSEATTTIKDTKTTTIRVPVTTNITSEKNSTRKVKPKILLNKGHTKGVILGDNDTAVWMIHSVPKYPPRPFTSNNTNYSYPTTAMKYGQSFLCITVGSTTLETIAVQLKYNTPRIFYSSLPDGLKEKLPNLNDVMNNKTVEAAPWNHTENFTSLGGRKFVSFAKSYKFNDDLYSGLVAKYFKLDLFVESWINGPGVLDSECARPYEVFNVMQIKSPVANITFSSHHDHSKWAVATTHLSNKKVNNTDLWVCVGDINRAAAQAKRGGGTVCTCDTALWENYAQLINAVKPCNSTLKYYD